MAKKPKSEKTIETTHYRHDEAKRKNIPSAAMEAEGKVPLAKRVKYAYSPHLEPVLRFDPKGRADAVGAIVEKACRGDRLNAADQEILRAVGKNWEQPWLEWAGKQEEHARGQFSVDPVALHIHERISAQAILRNAMREDAQRSLFGDPEQTYAEALQFYEHDIDWANRIVLGDSLQVMSSLAVRENLEERVQAIYFDPPYGIGFKSNFQPNVDKKNVRDSAEEDLTRESEMVRAYRDTWRLGRSSYLSYLRDRFAAAKRLLTESGSIFVQISEENSHLVRTVMEEVFGSTNFIAQISFRKKLMPLGGKTLEGMHDYILWFAKKKDRVKYRQIYIPTEPDPDGRWTGVRDENQVLRRFMATEGTDFTSISPDALLFGTVSQWAPSFSPSNAYELEFQGRRYSPTPGQCWVTTHERMTRLMRADRLFVEGDFPRYVSFHSDFPLKKLTYPWCRPNVD